MEFYGIILQFRTLTESIYKDSFLSINVEGFFSHFIHDLQKHTASQKIQ